MHDLCLPGAERNPPHRSPNHCNTHAPAVRGENGQAGGRKSRGEVVSAQMCGGLTDHVSTEADVEEGKLVRRHQLCGFSHFSNELCFY